MDYHLDSFINDIEKLVTMIRKQSDKRHRICSINIHLVKAGSNRHKSNHHNKKLKLLSVQ